MTQTDTFYPLENIGKSVCKEYRNTINGKLPYSNPRIPDQQYLNSTQPIKTITLLFIFRIIVIEILSQISFFRLFLAALEMLHFNENKKKIAQQIFVLMNFQLLKQ